MKTSKFSLWAGLLGALWGGSAWARAEPPRTLRLTLLTAELARVKVRAHAHQTPRLEALSCLTQPGLRARKDECLVGPPGEGPELNPQARLESPALPGQRIETFAVPRSATPRWDYSVILDVATIGRGKYVDLSLFDQHGGDDAILLGGKRLPVKELLKLGTRKVKLGAAELTYRVEAVGEPRRYHFLVPVSDPVALARDAQVEASEAQPVYQLVPVAEGEQLTVAVKPQLKTRRRPTPGVKASKPAAPAGATGAAASLARPATVDECLGCSRATLRGAIGDARFVVLAEQAAARAGLLALSVADLPQSAAAPIYEGGLEVELVVGASMPSAPTGLVAPPLASAARGRGAGRGRAEGAGAAVLERVIDAHDAEIQGCVTEVADPTGEVVLLFSIASDGAPLGVVVERSTPNLHKAGECIRQRALRWRFPPSNSVVSARYPMKFSTQ